MTEKRAKKISKSGYRREVLSFKVGLDYLFNRQKGMLNAFWIFVPIFGWLALIGYYTRIVKEFCDGKYEKLPLFSFFSDMKFGTLMILKAIPFCLVYLSILGIISSASKPLGDFFSFLLGLFVVPLLSINFMNKQTVGAFFDFSVVKPVFTDFVNYAVALVKSVVLILVFVFPFVAFFGLFFALLIGKMSFTALLTILLILPILILYSIIFLFLIALVSFIQDIFLADFYRRNFG